MNTIALFKSIAFSQSWPDANSDPNEPLLGRDLAELLRQRVLGRGVDAGIVVEATGGWEFELTIDPAVYIFFVHWAPIGDPPADYWVVQTRMKKSLLKVMFGTSLSGPEAQPAVDLLRAIIEESLELTDVRWVSSNQFKELY